MMDQLQVFLRLCEIFEIICDFFHDLYFCSANHGLIFVFVKEITTMMVLRHLMYVHLTKFELYMLHRHK